MPDVGHDSTSSWDEAVVMASRWIHTMEQDARQWMHDVSLTVPFPRACVPKCASL